MLSATVALLWAAVGPLSPAVGNTDECLANDAWSGCIASIEDSDAVLRGDTSSRVDPRDSASGSDSGSTAPSAPPACDDCDPWMAPRDGYEVVVVTISDIARFRPTPALQRGEPGGWAVIGLPANIYADARTQVVPGTLLGEPAEVRFTPTGFHWDYGDGSSAASASPGATWAVLGLREFDATPTSHVFTQRGDYTIRLDVTYRAEYRLGSGGFVPIPGTLALPANDIRVSARSAGTVLVDRTCTRAPTGPGC